MTTETLKKANDIKGRINELDFNFVNAGDQSILFSFMTDCWYQEFKPEVEEFLEKIKKIAAEKKGQLEVDFLNL